MDSTAGAEQERLASAQVAVCPKDNVKTSQEVEEVRRRIEASCLHPCTLTKETTTPRRRITARRKNDKAEQGALKNSHCTFFQRNVNNNNTALDTKSLATDKDTKEMDCRIIICDAWFGFPSQTRPRNERIRAVSRQLFHFTLWQQQQQQQRSKDWSTARVIVVGATKDVEAIQHRWNQLLAQGKRQLAIQFRPNVSVEEVLNDVSTRINGDEPKPYETSTESDNRETQEQPALHGAQHNDNDDWKRVSSTSLVESPLGTGRKYCYLSPDAPQALSLQEQPPPVVIVGLLVDRQIRQDRSWRRASQVLQVPAAQLPLEAVGVSNREPLNIDTVLQVMQEWWWLSASSTTATSSFPQAALSAMATHESRHPNRTLHLSQSHPQEKNDNDDNDDN